MSPPATRHPQRELARRASGGIEVTLCWAGDLRHECGRQPAAERHARHPPHRRRLLPGRPHRGEGDVSVTAPPRPPRDSGPSDPVDREQVEALVEALIEEVQSWIKTAP